MVGDKYLDSDQKEDKVLFSQFQFKDPSSLLRTLMSLTVISSRHCRVQTHPEVSGASWGQLLSTAARCASRGDAHLDLILVIREKQVRDVKSNVSLGCSPHEVVGSELSKGVSKESSRVHMPGLRGEDLGLFRALVSGMPLGDSVWE